MGITVYINALQNGFVFDDMTTIAHNAYRRIIELDPADLEAYNNLGVAHAMQGEIGRTVELREKVLEMGPNNQKATDNIAKAKKIID